MKSRKHVSAQDVRDLHERHMAGGQSCLFSLEDGRLKVRAEQRHWLTAHRDKATRMLGLQSTERFADLGCGEGYLSLFLAQRAGWSIGLDFTASSLQVLKAQPEHNGRQLQLLVASGDSVPLPDTSVDKLLCNHVLEHVLDDDAVMREIRRVVRPGGLILIGVPLELGPQVRFAIRLRRFLLPRSRLLQLEKAQPGQLVTELIGQQSHIRFYSLQAVEHLLERNRFRVLRAEGVGLSLRGRANRLFRRSGLLFGLSIAVGRLFPAITTGVLVLAERRPG
jgi:ubiquinone/menaquinone biosynthesis C-methylase UbiE